MSNPESIKSNPYLFRPQSLENDSASPCLKKKISQIFTHIKESLIINFQKIIYFIRFSPSESREYIFQNQIICKTTNQVKIEDIEECYHLSQNPLFLTPKGYELLGTLPLKEEFKLAPDLNKGKCGGGSALFLHDYLTSKDIHKTAQRFADGVPLEGVLIHEIGKEVCNQTVMGWNDSSLGFQIDVAIEKHLIKKLPQDASTLDLKALKAAGFHTSELNAAAHYLPPDLKEIQKTFSAPKEDLQNPPGEASQNKELHVLDGVNAFFQNKAYEKNISLTTYVQQWVEIVYGEKIDETFLKELEFRDTILKNEEPLRVYQKEKIFAYSDLKIESAPLVNKGPQEALDKISRLEPGAYYLSFPVYGCLGKTSSSHAVAFIVDPSGLIYLYDSNFAVGWFLKGESRQTFARLFDNYTGILQSDKIDGKIDRIFNFIYGRPNPPLGPERDKGYFLYKVILK